MGELAGVVLAGGRSSRMGTAKADLDWHGTPLLRHVCGLVERAVNGPVVVVRARDQQLPSLPPEIQVVEDPVPEQGPLRGLTTGLSALADPKARAFVCSVDLPLLHPALVTRLARESAEVVQPVVGGYPQPLAALWSLTLLPRALALLEAGGRRLSALADQSELTRLDETALLTSPLLAAHDPELLCTSGANTPEQYAALLAKPAPPVTVRCFGVLARRAGAGPHAVRAASVGAAATAVGLVLDGHLLAAVNGEATVRDPLVPLVAGDEVALLSADAGG